jgi:hypothetical protein
VPTHERLPEAGEIDAGRAFARVVCHATIAAHVVRGLQTGLEQDCLDPVAPDVVPMDVEGRSLM